MCHKKDVYTFGMGAGVSDGMRDEGWGRGGEGRREFIIMKNTQERWQRSSFHVYKLEKCSVYVVPSQVKMYVCMRLIWNKRHTVGWGPIFIRACPKWPWIGCIFWMWFLWRFVPKKKNAVPPAINGTADSSSKIWGAPSICHAHLHSKWNIWYYLEFIFGKNSSFINVALQLFCLTYILGF